MSFVNTSVVVTNLFATGWGPRTSVCYDNIPFTPPNESYWVALSVLEGSAIKATVGMGQQLRRIRGTVALTLYCPLNKGTAVGREHMEYAAAIFRDKQVTGVTFMEPVVRRLGEASLGQDSSKPAVFLMEMSVPFYLDMQI